MRTLYRYITNLTINNELQFVNFRQLAIQLHKLTVCEIICCTLYICNIRLGISNERDTEYTTTVFSTPRGKFYKTQIGPHVLIYRDGKLHLCSLQGDIQIFCQAAVFRRLQFMQSNWWFRYEFKGLLRSSSAVYCDRCIYQEFDEPPIHALYRGIKLRGNRELHLNFDLPRENIHYPMTNRYNPACRILTNCNILTYRPVTEFGANYRIVDKQKINEAERLTCIMGEVALLECLSRVIIYVNQIAKETEFYDQTVDYVVLKEQSEDIL